MSWYDLETVLSRAELPDVARRLGMDVERKGGSLLVQCPFHDDTRPSLVLYPGDAASKPHFHCFSCNAHGHAVDLVKKVQGSDFKSAVAWLASLVGVAPVRRQGKGSGEGYVSTEDALSFAKRVFDQQHEPKVFAEWCQGRGFDPAVLHELGLRCLGSGSALVRALRSESYGAQVELIDELCSRGLLIRLRAKPKDSAQGSLDLEEQFRDYFHDGRILIPIAALTGQTVGYAGRFCGKIMSVQERPPAKYLLTPGFQKSEVLFNGDRAKKLLSKPIGTASASPAVYVVEGFLDALRLHALGLSAVAVMGTSLSTEQRIRLLQVVESARLSDGQHLRLRIFFDRDPAGFDGTCRLARQLIGLEGLETEWIGFNADDESLRGKDPDEILKQVDGNQAVKLLDSHSRPIVSALIAASLGYKDATPLMNGNWEELSSYPRERALVQVIRILRSVSASTTDWRARLTPKAGVTDAWHLALNRLMDGRLQGSVEANAARSRNLGFLVEQEAKANHARMLAEHGARRGELPCDDETWRALDRNAPLFNELMLNRMQLDRWRQVDACDAVHLPRKLSADSKVLNDPRRKMMPHPADLHFQQFMMNELLTERHDFSHEGPRSFSDCIPAVRWFATEREVRVTGYFGEHSVSPTLHNGEEGEPTLSFGYQIDMDVLEGRRKPSDQGMFRPYMDCWRSFMDSLARQAKQIGPRLHVMRLDAKRYYDNIEKFVLRDRLLGPIEHALAVTGLEDFEVFRSKADDSLPERLVNLLCDSLYGQAFSDPDSGIAANADAVIGIPQGPVLSAWMGTIALFPVDGAARSFMRNSREVLEDGSTRCLVGYARYVDDIVLLADSEARLEAFRQVVVEAASVLKISLVRKGESVVPGSPNDVMSQLNQGRILAASVPAWEPPMRGDGEAGWGTDSDASAPVDRQCALQLLRHPVLFDDPSNVHELIRDVMRAPNLRPGDLGRCARALWWQVAIQDAKRDGGADQQDVWSTLYQHYLAQWTFVCAGHRWANAFNERGYHVLIAIEGLDMLLDSCSAMESGRSGVWVGEHRAAIVKLEDALLHADDLLTEWPSHNGSHIKRRVEKLQWKAWKARRSGSIKRSAVPHSAQTVAVERWLCLAAVSLNRFVVSDGDGGEHPLKEFSGFGRDDLAPSRIASACNYLVNAPQGPEGGLGEVASEAQKVALQFLVANTTAKCQAQVLKGYPRLLGNGLSQALTILPPLPLQDAGLWAYETATPTGVMYAFKESSESPLPDEAYGSKLDELAIEIAPSFKFAWRRPATELAPKLWRFESGTSASVTFNHVPRVNRARFASGLYRALHAIYKQHNELETELVPVWAHVVHMNQTGAEAEGECACWYLIAEPVSREKLGVMAFVSDGSGGLRSINVPNGEHAPLWRIGCAVSDAIGIAVDLPGDGACSVQEDDEGGGEQADTLRDLSEIEGFVLRQQLSKLRGTWLSDAQVRGRGVEGLPRTIERALGILQDFDASAPEEEQVLQALCVEVETQAMAMRLQKQGPGDLRSRLHLLPAKVLNRIPLRVIECLTLERPDAHGPLRTDLALMLSWAKKLLDCLAVSQLGEPDNRPSLEPLRALALSACLAAAGAAMRGLFASAWGIARLRPQNSLPTVLPVPGHWVSPEGGRLDPADDYAKTCRLATEDDWGRLSTASPWQMLLLLLGVLQDTHPQSLASDKENSLQLVYEHLRVWQSVPGASVDDVGWAWPFEELPKFDCTSWSNFLVHLLDAVKFIDAQLGVVVDQVQAPTFSRHQTGKHFTDTSSQQWSLCLVQYTGLGRTDSVARVVQGKSSRRLVTWSEVRRRLDGELLSVHTLDEKLGQWCSFTGVKSDALEVDQLVANIRGAEDAEAGLEVQTLPFATIPFHGQVEVAPENPTLSLKHDGRDYDPPTSSALSRRLDELSKRFSSAQVSSWERRKEIKSAAHVRIALLQWSVDETHSHPIAEAGVRGLGLPPSGEHCLRSTLLNESTYKNLDCAAKSGGEHLWQSLETAPSWPEHRRRRLLERALETCHRLGVELLVLPEVSMRPATLDWLAKQLKTRFQGLAVLAGTYRNFGESLQVAPEGLRKAGHLESPLTLLWSPDNGLGDIIAKAGGSTPLWFQRGKKYRAIAAKEFLRPDWSELQPLFQLDPMLRQLQLAHVIQKPDLLIPLLLAIERQMPAMRYCMELICSELFLLTSPANMAPLAKELEAMLRRFPGATSDVGLDIVRKDVLKLGEYLSIEQGHGCPRRSVLLVPAATSRTNDYWHAGQASVLASGTATVFCNAVIPSLSVGGSCFIGIDSASKQGGGHVGMIDLTTPYHGWRKGILSSRAEDALSEADQALVVVDVDPVHVVSGKPRPQLLPEPMSLVGYFPIAEMLDRVTNAKSLANAMAEHLQSGGRALVQAEEALAGVARRRKMVTPANFWGGVDKLLQAGVTPSAPALDTYADMFSDAKAIRGRLLAYQQDREQQPATHSNDLREQPAWLDVLPVDLTLQLGQKLPDIAVPPWGGDA